MHPILAYRSRLLLYLALWLVFGIMLATAMSVTGTTSGIWSVVMALPLALLLGVQSLSCWYLVRVLPLGQVPAARLAGSWIGAGLLLLTFWLLAAVGWAQVLRSLGGLVRTTDSPALMSMLILCGATGLLAAVMGQYLLASFERTRESENRVLETQMLRREAETHLLRRQLDPHFLFNSLNSMAALIGTNPIAARRMCSLLADFFRDSLKIGARSTVALDQEVDLTRKFAQIAQIRFADRLHLRFDIDADVGQVQVPSLVLQPLVENAMQHGIAHLLSGGDVVVEAHSRNGLLELSVENACDSDRPPSNGTGIGLANVRGRIEMLYGTRARFSVSDQPQRFRVVMLLPMNESQGGESAHPDHR